MHHHFSRMGRVARELSARIIMHGLASDSPAPILTPEASFDIINTYYPHHIDMERFEDVSLLCGPEFCGPQSLTVLHTRPHSISLSSSLFHD